MNILDILDFLEITDTETHEIDAHAASTDAIVRVTAAKLPRHTSMYLLHTAKKLGCALKCHRSGKADPQFAVVMEGKTVTNQIVEIVKFRQHKGKLVTSAIPGVAKLTNLARRIAVVQYGGIPADLLKRFDISIDPYGRAWEWKAEHRVAGVELDGSCATFDLCLGDLILTLRAWVERYAHCEVKGVFKVKLYVKSEEDTLVSILRDQK